MKILKSIFMIILMLFLFMLAIILIVFKSGLFTGDVKDYVRAEIIKNTGKNVRIGKIEVGFINNIVLKDVEIPLKRTFGDEGAFISCRGIIFRFNIIDIFLNKKEIDKTLSRIVVDSPEINIVKRGGKFNISEFKESFVLPGAGSGSKKTDVFTVIPVTRMLVEGGRINFRDEDKKFYTEIINLKGSFSMGIKSRKISAYLSGRTKFSARRNIKVDAEYELDSGRFKAGIEGRNADLNHWAGYAVPLNDVKIKTGGFSFNVDANGTGFTPDKLKMQGNLEVNNGNILIGNVPVNRINADVTMIRDRIHINDMNFEFYEGDGIIKGSVSDLFGKREYDADFLLKNVNMAAVDKRLFTGFARASIRAKGNSKKNNVSGGVYWEKGSVHGMDVKNIEVQADLKGSAVRIKQIRGILGDGTLSGNGNVSFKGARKIDIKAGLKGLNMQKATGIYEVSGPADIETKIFGTTANPVIRAAAKSKKTSWGGNEIENITAGFVLGRKGIIGSAEFDYKMYKGLSVSAKIMDEKETVEIKHITLSEKAERLVDIAGKYVKSGKQVDLTAELNNIKISGFSFDFLKGKDIDGSVSGKIRAAGDISSPVVAAELAAAPLEIKGRKNDFSIKINFADNVIKVEDIVFNESLKGTGEFSLKKKIFNVNMDINKFRGYVLKEITGFEIFDNSVIDGKVFVKKEDDGYGGSVIISSSYKDSIYKSVNVDAAGEKNDFIINGINIIQNKGSMSSSGRCTVKKDEDVIIQLSGALSSYRINSKLADVDAGFYLDSKMKITEKHRTSASGMKITEIKFNGEPVDDFEMSLKTVNKSVTDFSAGWGAGYEASGKLFDAKVPEIDFSLKLKDADLFPVYAVMDARKKGLPPGAVINGGLELKGKINNALLSAVIEQTQGTVSLHGDVALAKRKSGYFPHRLNLKYRFDNADLNSFALIFDEDFKETGRLNGSGVVKGKPENPESGGSIELKTGILAGFNYDFIRLKYLLEDKKFNIDSFKFNYKNQMLDIYNSQVEMKKESYYATIKSRMDNFIWRGNYFTGGLNFYGRISNFKTLKIDGSVSSEDFMFKLHKFRPFLIKVNYDSDGITLKSRKGNSDIDVNIGFTNDKILFNKVEISDAQRGKYFDITGFINKNKGDSDMRINGVSLDPQMINDLLGWEHRWGGSLDGNIKISGNPENGLRYAILVSIHNGMVNDIPYDIFSGLFILKDNWLDFSPVDPLILMKEGKYELKLTGVIPVPMSDEGIEKTNGASMDLKAEMKGGDLSIINFLKFIESAEGPTDANMHITGTKEYPSVNGTLNIEEGRVRLKYLFREFDNIYGNIIIKDNVIDIYSLRGDSEKGTLKIENLDNEKKGGYLKWYKPHEINWRMTNIGDKLYLSDTKYMEFLKGDVDIDLEVTGLLMAPAVRGTIRASDLRCRYPVKMMDEKGEAAPAGEDNFVKQINWDIEVYGGENVYYYNDYYNNYVELCLKWGENPLIVRGKGNDLKMYGNITLTRGVYKYLNTEFSVDDTKESKAVFDGMIMPVLDVYAKTTKRRIELASSTKSGIAGTVDLDILLRMWGRVGNAKIEITSDPSLERNRLLYILTFGRDLDPDKGVGDKDFRKLADAIANSWIKQGTEKIKDFMKLDEFIIKLTGIFPDAEESPGGGTTTAKDDRTEKIEIGIGQQLTEDIFFRYKLRLMEERFVGGLFPEQEVGAEISLDDAMKVITKGIFRTADDPYLVPFEGFAGIEWSRSFDTWGVKKTETPEPAAGGAREE